MTKKIVVFGANGFIGKNVMDICKDYECLGLVRKETQTETDKHIYVNIKSMKYSDLKDLIQEYKPDVCIDLAWEDISNYTERVLKKNKESKRKILELMKEINIKKIVMCGTCWEYGQNKGELKEEDEGVNVGEFGKIKKEIYNMSKKILKNESTELIWARIFYSYGYGQRETSLIPYIYKKLKKEKNIILKDVNGANDLVYVKDVAEALKLIAIIDVEEGIYNIGSGKLTTNKYILNKMIGLTKNARDSMQKEDIKSEENHSWAKTEKIREMTGWSATTSIENGLSKMIDELKVNNNE